MYRVSNAEFLKAVNGNYSTIDDGQVVMDRQNTSKMTE